MTETELQKRIKKKLNDLPNCVFVKNHGGPHSVRGIPDLTGCVEGTFVALEVKRPGKEKTLTKIQKYTLDQLEGAGAIVGVVTSVEEALEIVEPLISLA